MTLLEFLHEIKVMTDANPALLNINLAYASDDEGNEFKLVTQEPTLTKVEDLDAYFLDVLDDDVEPVEYAEGDSTVLVIN